MIILPTVRQLKYFIALAEALSFSKAAENCYVTQSTLSASIKDLEDILGQPLFERSSRHVLLTYEGEQLLARAHKILDDLQDMVLSISKSSAPLSGKLRLGIIPTIAPYVIPSLMLSLAETYPDLDLVIEEGMSHDIVQKLERGEIDTALLALPYDIAHFDYRSIAHDPFYLATAQPPKNHTKFISTNEIDHDRLLLLEDGHCLKDHVLDACQITKGHLKTNLHAASLDTLLRMVDKGLGDTLIPQMAVKADYYNTKNVRYIPFTEDDNAFREITLIWRKASVLPQDFELLGDAIKNVI